MNNRQRDILTILYEAGDFITIDQIANRLEVSSRTIRGDLAAIRQEYPGLEQLITRPNRGVCFTGTKAQLDQLAGAPLRWQLPMDYKSQRGLLTACLLLKASSITLTQVGEQMYLSRSMASKALDEGESWLSLRGISVIRRRGLGFSIDCDEYRWRMAMWDMYSTLEQSGLIEDGGTQRGTSFGNLEETVAGLRWFLDGFDAAPIVQIITGFEQSYGFYFSYQAKQQLLFHTSLCILRNRKGKAVFPPPLTGNDLDMHHNGVLAEHLIRQLEARFELSLPGGEQEYLRNQLGVAEIQGFNTPALRQVFQLQYPILCSLTAQIIDMTSRILGLELSVDVVLSNHLFLYLRSAVARLAQGVHIANPLLSQIKEKYPKIYTAAWSASVVFESRMGLDVNENELGFLALHIGGAVERITFRSRVLILCNYGMSVYRLLKIRLEKAVAGITVEGVISSSEEAKARRSNCDFIISTLPMEKTFGGKDVVVVDNFLLASDVKAVENKMHALRRGKRDSIGTREEKVLELFEPALIFLQRPPATKWELLEDMCRALEKAGHVTPEFLESVLAREKAVSTEVGPGVAIPHGAARHVLRPMVAVAVLREPILWSKESLVDTVFLLAFNLTDASPEKKDILRFYSAFAALLEDREGMNKLRKMTDPVVFARYINAIVKRGDTYP
ncbi:PTS sugar transporter subunit IIA [Oscillospiraceae bacterium MB08-C2-2]|nr:PTS sugar transporter subunit IIA [Oscillospiraceae bacterium MB08-C2-2]